MRNGHEGLHVWIAVAFIAIAGIALYLYIPQYKLASGATVGLVLLLVLKHVGLLAAFGAPVLAFLRRLVASHRRPEGEP